MPGCKDGSEVWLTVGFTINASFQSQAERLFPADVDC